MCDHPALCPEMMDEERESERYEAEYLSMTKSQYYGTKSGNQAMIAYH